GWVAEEVVEVGAGQERRGRLAPHGEDHDDGHERDQQRVALGKRQNAVAPDTRARRSALLGAELAHAGPDRAPYASCAIRAGSTSGCCSSATIVPRTITATRSASTDSSSKSSDATITAAPA